MEERLTKLVVQSPLTQTTGYTKRAVEGKIAAGVWLEGVHFRRAPDGHILIDLEGYERWVENQRPGA